RPARLVIDALVARIARHREIVNYGNCRAPMSENDDQFLLDRHPSIPPVCVKVKQGALAGGARASGEGFQELNRVGKHEGYPMEPLQTAACKEVEVWIDLDRLDRTVEMPCEIGRSRATKGPGFDDTVRAIRRNQLENCLLLATLIVQRAAIGLERPPAAEWVVEVDRESGWQ